MKVLAADRQELVDAVVAENIAPGVSAALLEKDEHLTDALRAIFQLRPENLGLVFCGGSSLSKAHGVIERMSEDADIKVVLTHATPPNPTKLRTDLSKLKGSVNEALAAVGLKLVDSGALNANRYFYSHWAYQAGYPSVVGLRPQLQVEFTQRAPVLPTSNLAVHRLVDRLAKRVGDGFQIPTVDVAETVAEKVLSFLRRYEQHRRGHMQREWDAALVRHIYDVYCISSAQPAVVHQAAPAFSQLVRTDVVEFGKQFPDFSADPRTVMEDGLARIGGDDTMRQQYETHLLPLIYGQVRPDFSSAFSQFQHVAVALLNTLSYGPNP